MKPIKFVLLLILTTGCSSTNKSKVYTTIFTSLVAGAVSGSNSAPDGENNNAHALMWAGVAGTLGALTAINVFDDSIKVRDLEKRNANQSIQLSAYRERFDPKTISKGKSLLNSPIPNELRSIVSPGSWEHYKLDRWVKSEEEENTWFRQTEMFRIQLPELD